MGDDSLKSSSAKYFDDTADSYQRVHYERAGTRSMRLRQEVFLDFVDQHVEASPAEILDIGCGPGHLSIDLAERGHRVVGLDIADEMLRIARTVASERRLDAQVEFVKGDCEATGLGDGCFDAVLAAGVIEYMEDDGPMLAECQRVLKPGGLLVLNVTNRFGWLGLFIPVTNILKQSRAVQVAGSFLKRALTGRTDGVAPWPFQPRRHSPSGFVRRLEASGFHVVEKRFMAFALLPSPFSTLLERLTTPLDALCERLLWRTPLRVIGNSQIVVARKRAAPRERTLAGAPAPIPDPEVRPPPSFPTRAISRRYAAIARGMSVFGAPHLARVVGHQLTILCYHCFSVGPSRHYLEVPRDTLRLQLDWYRAHTRVLDLETALGRLERGERLSWPSVAFSIDDSDAQALETAREEFGPRGLPVTLGFPAGLMAAEDDPVTPASRALFRLSLLPVAEQLEVRHGWGAGARDVSEYLLGLDPGEAARRGDELTTRVGGYEPLTERPLARLHEVELWPGARVAAHGMTHANLARAGDAQLRWEVRESRRRIAARFGDCRSFIYPYGSHTAVDARAEAALEAAGYRYAFTAVADLVRRGAPRYRIGRTTGFETRSPAFLRAQARGALIPFGLLRSRFRLRRLPVSCPARLGEHRSPPV